LQVNIKNLIDEVQRGGQVVINLMANVKQKTIEPFLKDPIIPGTRV
jgi:hypothetical protein